MKAFSVILVVCGLSAGLAAPAARVSRLGLALGRQGLANAGIGIGSMATNMATGLASSTLGALGGIPILGPFAQMGQAAVETGNNFAQMGMGIGQMAVNGFGGLRDWRAAQQQLPGSQQLAGNQQFADNQPFYGSQQFPEQAAAQQQLAAQLGAQQQLIAQLGAHQQLASQLAAQQQTSHAGQQQGIQQDGSAQQPAANIRQTETFQDVFGSPELDSWWNPSPPEPVYVG